MPPNAMGHDTPNFTVSTIKAHHRIIGVRWYQQPFLAGLLKPFDSQFAMDRSNDDIIRFGAYAPVDDKKVTVENSCIFHGFTGCTDKECCRWPTNQMLVQIEFAFNVVIGRGWKSGRNAGRKDAQSKL